MMSSQTIPQGQVVNVREIIERQIKAIELEASRLRSALAAYGGEKIRPQPVGSVSWGKRIGDKESKTAEALASYLRSAGQPITLEAALKGLIEAGHQLAGDPNGLKNLAISIATNPSRFYREGPGVSTDEIGLVEWGVTA